MEKKIRKENSGQWKMSLLHLFFKNYLQSKFVQLFFIQCFKTYTDFIRNITQSPSYWGVLSFSDNALRSSTMVFLIVIFVIFQHCFGHFEVGRWWSAALSSVFSKIFVLMMLHLPWPISCGLWISCGNLMWNNFDMSLHKHHIWLRPLCLSSPFADYETSLGVAVP